MEVPEGLRLGNASLASEHPGEDLSLVNLIVDY
jgi:hypothetical protein